MTADGIFQLALYVVVLLALAKPLGAYMARVYEGQPFGLDRALGLARAPHLPSGPASSPDRGDGLEDLRGDDARLQPRRPARGVRPPAPAGHAAAEPARAGGRVAGLLVQHRGELRHEHELAGLWRRDDDELSHADAGPHRPELRLGGGGHGDRWPRSSGASRAARPRRSAISGSISPGRRSTSCCRCRSSWRWCWSPRAWCRRSARMPRSRSSSPASTTSRSPTRTASRSSTTRASPRPRKSTLTEQVIAVGPAASQIAIKQLGTNGGGFFNANSAHPFENPTPLSNLLELLADPA